MILLYRFKESSAIGDLIRNPAQDALQCCRLLVEFLECVFTSIQAVFYHCRFSGLFDFIAMFQVFAEKMHVRSRNEKKEGREVVKRELKSSHSRHARP